MIEYHINENEATFDQQTDNVMAKHEQQQKVRQTTVHTKWSYKFRDQHFSKDFKISFFLLNIFY